MHRQARRLVDRRLATWRSLPPDAVARPEGGWVRVIRQALGMTIAELADRMGVSRAAVSKLEASERRGTVALQTLTRAADALDCDLVYALVPRRPLEVMVEDRAKAVATALYRSIATSMSLEEQELQGEAVADAIDDLTAEIKNRPGLWSTGNARAGR